MILVRYVQGMSVLIHGLKTISVTGNVAHDWPDVYFEGVRDYKKK